MLTVDPGPEHTGIALWFYYPGRGWRCDHAQEISPGDFVTSLENYLKSNSLGTVVYESWQLYADKAQQQVGSELETVQLIGVIRYLVERDEPDWPFEPVQLFKQPASIKKATKAILGRKKVVSVAKRLRMDPDGHAFEDRKSTRLNSSHVAISYAVFCLKKKSQQKGESPGAQLGQKKRMIIDVGGVQPVGPARGRKKEGADRRDRQEKEKEVTTVEVVDL